MTKFENGWGYPYESWFGLKIAYLIWIPQPFSNLVIIYLPPYGDGTECSETSAYKIQTPGELPRRKHTTPKHYFPQIIFNLQLTRLNFLYSNKLNIFLY
jgi:hypothetical protein